MPSNYIHALPLPAGKDFEISFYISDQQELLPARIYPRHMHDQVEVLLLLHGSCAFSVERELCELHPGEAIVIRPNEAHHCVREQASTFGHICFWMTPLQEGALQDYPLFSPDSPRCMTLAAEAITRLQAIARQLTPERDPLQQLHLIYELLWLLKTGSPTPSTDHRPVPDLLRQILLDIDRHYAQIDRLDYLTEKYFISHSTLGRLFRTHLHTTPKQYLESKRLAQSRILLRQGCSVCDACQMVGFSDYSNYIRLFRSRFGRTPKQYQRSQPFEIALKPYEDK